MTIDELLNNIGEYPAIRDYGKYNDYKPESTHKDVLYIATDTKQILLNGEEYGNKVDQSILDEIYKSIDDNKDEIESLCANTYQAKGNYVEYYPDNSDYGYSKGIKLLENVQTFLFPGLPKGIHFDNGDGPNETYFSININNDQITLSNRSVQGALRFDNEKLEYSNNSYSSWYKIWHSGNFTPSDYLPLTGGTISNPNIDGFTIKRTASNKGAFTTYSNNDITLGRLGIRGDLSEPVPTYVTSEGENKTLWHSGNDGEGSGLDADLLDGKHLSQISAERELFFKKDYENYVVLLFKANAFGTYRLNGKLYTQYSASTRYQAADVDIWYSRWDNPVNQDMSFRVDTYGLGTSWKLITCMYEGKKWFALQHTNIQSTRAFFLGTSKDISFTSIHYRTSNSNTIINEEINDSIEDQSNKLSVPKSGGVSYALVSDNVESANHINTVEIDNSVDLNDLKPDKFTIYTHRMNGGSNYATNKNLPTTKKIYAFSVECFKIEGDKEATYQRYTDNYSNFIRYYDSVNGWHEWKKILTEDDAPKRLVFDMGLTFGNLNQGSQIEITTSKEALINNHDKLFNDNTLDCIFKFNDCVLRPCAIQANNPSMNVDNLTLTFTTQYKDFRIFYFTYSKDIDKLSFSRYQ